MGMAELQPQSHSQTMTAEDLWKLRECPGVRYELLEGEPVELPGAGGVQAELVVRLFLVLHAFASSRSRGQVFPDALGYILRRHPDMVRIPDVSFIARDHIPETGMPEGFVPFAPDLAVEIVSPNDRAVEVHEKVHEYLEAGTRMVWVLCPRHRSVTVYLPAAIVRELGPDAELDGGEVLPGFRMQVADLYSTTG